MAKLIFKLNSVPDDEADDVKRLLADNNIDFYETPAGNWGISLHGLWLKDEEQTARAKQLIDDYQFERAQRIRQEMQQKIEDGEMETALQRMINRPVQTLMLLAVILFILYFSVMPFIQFGQV